MDAAGLDEDSLLCSAWVRSAEINPLRVQSTRTEFVIGALVCFWQHEKLGHLADAAGVIERTPVADGDRVRGQAPADEGITARAIGRCRRLHRECLPDLTGPAGLAKAALKSVERDVPGRKQAVFQRVERTQSKRADFRRLRCEDDVAANQISAA